MKNNALTACLTCCIAFLFLGLLVPMSQAAGRPIEQRLDRPVVSSGVAQSQSATGTLTTTLYLPSIARPTIDLYGYVTHNGLPVKDAPVTLWRMTPPYIISAIGSGTTEANGLYDFPSVPSISCDPDPGPLSCPGYYVEYYDFAHSPDRLLNWQTTLITNHVLGTAQQFPTFDISAPTSLFPHEDVVVSPTLTFTWTPRPFPEDNYGIEIWNPIRGSSLHIDNLGYTGAHTVTLTGNICNGPCSTYYNTPLQWGLKISNSMGDGSIWMTGPFTITTP